MSMLVSFVLSFFPRDVLDEILNLIESVSEGFPSYSYVTFSKGVMFKCLKAISFSYFIENIWNLMSSNSGIWVL